MTSDDPLTAEHGVAIFGDYGVTCRCTVVLDWPGGWSRNEKAATRVVARHCRVVGADREWLLNQYGEEAVGNIEAVTLAALPPVSGDEPGIDVEALARDFHETYERLAPSFGYETRKASAVPWGDVPENNRRLMVAVASEIAARLTREEKP